MTKPRHEEPVDLCSIPVRHKYSFFRPSFKIDAGTHQVTHAIRKRGSFSLATVARSRKLITHLHLPASLRGMEPYLSPTHISRTRSKIKHRDNLKFRVHPNSAFSSWTLIGHRTFHQFFLQPSPLKWQFSKGWLLQNHLKSPLSPSPFLTANLWEKILLPLSWDTSLHVGHLILLTPHIRGKSPWEY